MKKLNITDLKDKDIVYIIPLDDGGREIPCLARWGKVDLNRYRIRFNAGSFPTGSMDMNYGYHAYDCPKRISDKPLTLEQIKQESLVWAIEIEHNEEKDQSFGIWCDVRPDRLVSRNSNIEIKFNKDRVDGYNVYLSPPKPKELII